MAKNSLVALKLLSPDGEKAWPVMRTLSRALSDIEVDCSILECEGEPCLFVNMQDEFAATCRLKKISAWPLPSLSLATTPSDRQLNASSWRVYSLKRCRKYALAFTLLDDFSLPQHYHLMTERPYNT